MEMPKAEKKKRLHPAGIILWGMHILAFFRMPAALIEAHFLKNAMIWEQELAKKAGQTPWIEDQNAMSEFAYGREKKWLTKKLLSGRALSAKENACEVIAVYNALLSLSEPESRPDFARLLRIFETRGISLWGYFGTSFGAVLSYFKKSPYEMRCFRGRQITAELLQAAAKEGFGTCVMMAENKAGDLKEMVHTICISKESEGKWMAHNDYEGSKSYESLEEAVFGYHNRKGRPLGVILLKKPGENV